MLAGGGESCADIEHLRLQSDLFPSVPSDSTVFRTFHELSSSTRSGIAEAMAEMRAKVWSRSSLTTGKEPVILDIDASLVEVHTDTKEHAAPTRKGGFGFHPMLCFADATGEMLSGLLQWNLTGGEIDGPSLTRPDSLPHERSPLSREWSGLGAGGPHDGKGYEGHQHKLGAHELSPYTFVALGQRPSRSNQRLIMKDFGTWTA
jgi:hypothetical protein